MIRSVLDTNIFVGILITTKASPLFYLYENLLSQDFIHVTSATILEEVKEVISRKNVQKLHRLSYIDQQKFVEEIARFSYIVPGKITVDIIKSDPDDNKFLSTAIEGSATYVVSGDKHLLDLGEYEGIKMLKARNFLEEVLHKKIK